MIEADQEADEDLRRVPAAEAAEHGLHGPITISDYQRFQWVREQLEKEGVKIPMPTGN